MAPVKDADPAAVSLDSAFTEAMGAPPRPREPGPPADVDPEAPHGRDDAGVPLEPYGRTKAGKIRLSAAGRPAKDDKARTGPPDAGGGDGKPGQQLIRVDYSAGLAETADACWFVLSGLGKAGGKIPLVGRLVPEAKLAAEAAIFRDQQGELVSCVNIAAQHNPKARRFAEKCAEGGISWVLMCGFMAMPFLTMSVAVWQGDQALAARQMPTLAQLGQANEAEIEKFMNEMAEQFRAAAEAEGAAA